MFAKSIHWRLQLWYGTLLALLMAGLMGAFYCMERHAYIQRVDRQLEQFLLLALPALTPPPSATAPDEVAVKALARSQEVPAYYLAWTPSGELLARSPDAPEGVGRPGDPPKGEHTFFRTRAGFRELVHVTPRGKRVVIGTTLQGVQAALRRLAAVLAVLGVGVAAVGMLVGGWIAACALRPIALMSEAAEQIAGGDRSRRVDVRETESELGRLAGVLNTTFSRLEGVIDEQARFVADAAHELRTPVTVILAQAQTALARERSAGEYREALEACQRAAQRMRRLVESLLQLARLDACREAMKREPLDLAAVGAECAALLRPLVEQSGVSVAAEWFEARCSGDAELLGQVVTNLLSNAIQYNRADGYVRVRTQRSGARAEIAVINTGPGISEKDLPRVFDRFYRVEASRSVGRSGLGLAIAKAIVDAHGGTVTAESEPGGETTFTVSLPAI